MATEIADPIEGARGSAVRLKELVQHLSPLLLFIFYLLAPMMAFSVCFC